MSYYESTKRNCLAFSPLRNNSGYDLDNIKKSLRPTQKTVLATEWVKNEGGLLLDKE
jgi:hypothetical protein